MDLYPLQITVQITHPTFRQPITLFRNVDKIANALDQLQLPHKLRKQYHLSFDGVWLSESTEIREVRICLALPKCHTVD
jgi:hypothetical protein